MVWSTEITIRVYTEASKMKPADVNESNEHAVWRILYGKQSAPTKYKLKVGDQVKVTKHKRIFQKGYLPSWTEETLSIAQRIPRDPPVYRLKEADGDFIQGTFYEPELRKVLEKPDHLFRIEKTLKYRGKGASKEALVHWKGWPKKYDSWIPYKQLVFYVVVASDASIDQYPENTPSSFKMQLPSQLHLSEDWEVAMTHISYPHTWENIHSNQVSYLLRYNGEKEWTLPIYLPRDTCRTVEDLISGMNLARTLGYLNHRDLVPALDRTSSPTSVQLNKNQSVTLTATTTTIRRNDELVWGMLSKHSFQTMYVYSDLIESLVVGDVQANLLRMILPRGQPGEMVADEIKRPTYHRLRTSIFSSVEMN
ncbi:unnamed protein product [Porites evermanni]|uniref:Chromo domain-containing protein n=1 Tax=Porites evermanni TaxID=104178 RepID=A0ABN8M624_9CNID|nr:unnamed protein product [Porites evermanni]